MHWLFHRNGTAVAERDSYRETISLTGIILRDETALTGTRTNTSLSSSRTRKVSADAVLGLAYDTEEELLRARRVDSLTREITATENVLSELSQLNTEEERAESVRSAVLSLCADSARHDISSLRSDTLRVTATVFEDGTALMRSELEELQTELDDLSSDGTEQTNTDILTAPSAGLFCPEVDGYENLGPVLADNLTVSGLIPLLSYNSTVDRHAYGKLVTGSEWTLAAMVSEEEAAYLTVGSTVTPDLTAYRAGRPKMTVISISESENGSCAVVLRSEQGLSDTVSLRLVSCSGYTGEIPCLRVPEKAIREDKQYGKCVYTDLGDGPLLIPVTVLHMEDGEALISTSLLEAGDSVLVQRGFYKGKLLK